MTTDTHVKTEHSFDVIIVGAGISGINAAYRIQSQLPGYTYAILEARDDLGGTWDLFKFPGVRSDSDLFTFGFEFNPWNDDQPIAEGAAIQRYIRDTAHKYAIDEHILFQHRLMSVNWSSVQNTWSLSVDFNGESKIYKTRFMLLATGYFDHQEPLKTPIPGIHNFQGQVIHPQFWPEELDYKDRNIVIIGSGATAVTLLPKLAEQASRVTMVQRSPTYILSLPNWSNRWLSWILPWKVYQRLQRTTWIFILRIFFLFCRWLPGFSCWLLKLHVQIQLPSHITYNPHFKPRYKPWDQRLCISPDGDFFHSLRVGKADVRTNTIKTTTASGITLDSGETIHADIIIQATGLKVQVAGGCNIMVDGQSVNISEKYVWNGVMLQDIPNVFYLFGYANASWTLGVDATAHFVCRLLRILQLRGLVAAVPRLDDNILFRDCGLFDLSSTYMTLAERVLPKAADRGPWKPRDHYARDLNFALYGDIDDCLEFVQGSSLRLRPDVS